jgi:predicted DNA-binding protein (UPF0251 family)
MGRRPRPRVVRHWPEAVYYKPQGVPLRVLAEVVLGFDELEALRLADQEGLSQEEVGRQMQVSRATAGRILAEARRKVADALVTGKALRIEGGPAFPPPGPPAMGMPGFGPGLRRRGRRGKGFGRGHGRGGPPGAGW